MKIVSGFFCLSRHFLFFCFRSLVPSTRGWARQYNGKLCFVLVGKFLVMNFCVGISRKSCDRQTIALADYLFTIIRPCAYFTLLMVFYLYRVLVVNGLQIKRTPSIIFILVICLKYEFLVWASYKYKSLWFEQYKAFYSCITKWLAESLR